MQADNAGCGRAASAAERDRAASAAGRDRAASAAGRDRATSAEGAPPRPLVFMHIPKTSGIAVAHALVSAARPQRVFFGFDHAFFGAFTDFASVAPDLRALIHAGPASLPPDETVVRAHMSLSTLRAAYPRGRFLTVLREPFCRILSHYVFWRGFAPDQLAPWGGWAAISGEARGPLADFLASPRTACQIDNVATRQLLWPHPTIPDAGMIDPADDAALLAAAEERLLSLDFAGIIEAPGFTDRLGAFLGAPAEPERHNVSPPLPPALRTELSAELTPHARALLAARSRLDLALWNRLATRWGEDAAALRARVVEDGFARFARLLAGAEG